MRKLIAWLAIVTLAWPSLGPLPYVIGAHVHAHASGSDETADHAHLDASAIPGSPLHPVDHDCPECQVLKHLARCILAIAGVPIRLAVVPAIVAPPVVVVHVAEHVPARLPPVRAPPGATT